MAIGQMSSVYGLGSGRQYRTPYVNQIKGAYGQATQDVIARKKKEQEEAQLKFDQQMAKDQFRLSQQGFALDKERAKAESNAQKAAMGFNMGTLGYNIANRAGSNPGGFTMFNDNEGIFSSKNGINLGGLAGAGLAGYGAYQAMGGGAKGLAAGLGAGLATDMISGGGISSKLLDLGKSIPGIGGALGGIGDFLGGIF